MFRDVLALALGLSLLALSLVPACASNEQTPTSCSAHDAGACAWNGDCVAADRCEGVGVDNVGSAITCCVPGARGTLDAGAPCSSLDDCSSGVCTYADINGDTQACSGPCATNAGCPAVLPVCVLANGMAVKGSVPLDAGAFCGFQ